MLTTPIIIPMSTLSVRHAKHTRHPIPLFAALADRKACCVAEKMMDDIALHLSIDPLALRRANFAQTGNKTPYGQTLCDCPLPAMTDDLAKRAGYQKKRLEVSAFNQKHTRIKRGLALTR